MIGGTSKIPMIKTRLEQKFNNMCIIYPKNNDFDLMVSKGSSIIGSALEYNTISYISKNGNKDIFIEDVIQLPFCRHWYKDFDLKIACRIGELVVAPPYTHHCKACSSKPFSSKVME